MMRVVYVDTGLTGEIGHHATSLRLITAALRGRGHTVSVAAWAGLGEPWRSEFDAVPAFRQNTYAPGDNDPICGWLVGHFNAAQTTTEDFSRLGAFTPDDLLYVNSVQPAQLAAVHSFLAALPEAARPHTVVELGTDPGVEFVAGGDGISLQARDPRRDARAVLYRLVARQMAARPVPELHLMTFDLTSSQVYSMLLAIPVGTLPLPHGAVAPARLRGGPGPRTVAFLGHQRGEKGYQLVPAIALALLGRADVRLLVHNADPAGMPVVQDALRGLAQADARVVLDERPAGPELWRELLDQADLIVCPYSPDHFRAAYSALASEAVAGAIPFVAPESTTLARLLVEYEGGGATFAGHDPAAVAAAVGQVLVAFDHHAGCSVQAAARWAARMGSEKMVDAMLVRVAAATMQRRAPLRLAA